jgi:hypothetical protein
VICEDYARDLAGWRQRDFEWIPLHLTRDGAGNCQPCLRVVNARREDKRRTASALPVAGLRIERQPHQIAGVWNVRPSYHASWPTGVPQSLSSWRFRGVILATSCSREYVGRLGRITIAPFLTDTSTLSPSSTCASSATDFGRRRPKLLPHREICVIVAMYLH